MQKHFTITLYRAIVRKHPKYQQHSEDTNMTPQLDFNDTVYFSAKHGETIKLIKQSVCCHYKRPSCCRIPKDFSTTPHQVKETFSTLKDGPFTNFKWSSYKAPFDNTQTLECVHKDIGSRQESIHFFTMITMHTLLSFQ